MNVLLLSIASLLLMTVPCSGGRKEEPAPLFCIAARPTPVLNTPDFRHVFGGSGGTRLHRDASGLVREVEFIALPDTVFRIEGTMPAAASTIYRVSTPDYPYPARKGYFIDSRFVTPVHDEPASRVCRMPPRKDIIKSLLAAEGTPYIWGGNYRAGIPELLSFYPPRVPLTQHEKEAWMLRGLDCSGLLYEATGGCTPRNTSSLITFGEPVAIANLPADQIIQKVEPLDILVWKGHVIIVLDRERAVESRNDYDPEREGNQGGVRIRTLKDVLDETLRNRIPVDHYGEDPAGGKMKFVVRRWYKGSHLNY